MTLCPAQSRAWGIMRGAMTKKVPDFRPMVHQAQGAAVGMARLQRYGGFAMLHSLGTGKTLTGLGLLELTTRELGRPASMLVVAPKTVIGAWMADNEHYGADLLVLNKSAAQNVAALTRKLLERDARMDKRPLVVVVNYEMVWREPLAANIIAANFDIALCDESQKIKNRTAKSSKFMHRLARTVPRRVLSSGTPALESPLDWFSQMSFADITMFGQKWVQFAGRYGRQKQVTRDRAIVVFNDLDPKNVEEFEQLLFSRTHRVRSEDVLDLPELRDPIVHEFDLTPAERKVYDDMVRESIAELEDEFGTLGEVVANFVMTRELRLQQIAGGNAPLEEGLGNVQIDAKGPARLKAAMDLVDLILENGEKVIVFHRFTREGDQLKAALAKAGIKHVAIDGSTPQTDKNPHRSDFVRQFREDPETRVFVGQIDACNAGITLIEGRHTIYYSTSYSATTWEQSRMRNHRKGQTGAVSHHYLVARDTTDHTRLDSLLGKVDLSKGLSDGGWRRFIQGSM